MVKALRQVQIFQRMKRSRSKAAVIYYSRTGNTRLIAEAVAAAITAELIELRRAQPLPAWGLPGLVRAALQLPARKRPGSKPVKLVSEPAANLDRFDLLFIGTPVWFGSPAPALYVFLKTAAPGGQRVAGFCCYRLFKGKVFRRLAGLLPPGRVIATAAFKAPLAGDELEAIRQARVWAERVMRAIQ